MMMHSGNPDALVY